MQTILDILKRAGGWHPGLSLTIDNTPYMSLVIEALDELGPCGLPALSIAHYGEQNGDLMRDPEMCFELSFAGGVADLNPFYYRNDYIGCEQWSRFITGSDYGYSRTPSPTRELCKGVGPQSAVPGLRSGTRGTTAASRLASFSPTERRARQGFAPPPSALTQAQGERVVACCGLLLSEHERSLTGDDFHVCGIFHAVIPSC